MSPISIELIVTSAIGFAVLILSAIFPALKDQFETIAPAVVAIVMFIIASILGNQVIKVLTEASIRRAEIQAEVSVKVAQVSAVGRARPSGE